MPKTSTTYYTSEHASLAAAQEEKKNQQLYIYQCKYTGKHALVSCSLEDKEQFPNIKSSFFFFRKLKFNNFFFSTFSSLFLLSGDGREPLCVAEAEDRRLERLGYG